MNRINPVGLKGCEITERMRELMGIKTIVENKKTSVVELTKLGPDGKIYGIVRENHEYYIKTSDKKKDLVAEDFSYIGGLKNKKEFVYPSYAKATKQLSLKFNSLYEAYGLSGEINVLQTDNLLKEDVAGFNSEGSGFTNEGNLEGNVDGDDAEETNDEPELDEVQQAVHDMLEGKNPAKKLLKNKLSIAKSLNVMDDIIETFAPENKKKVYSIK